MTYKFGYVGWELPPYTIDPLYHHTGDHYSSHFPILQRLCEPNITEEAQELVEGSRNPQLRIITRTLIIAEHKDDIHVVQLYKEVKKKNVQVGHKQNDFIHLEIARGKQKSNRDQKVNFLPKECSLFMFPFRNRWPSYSAESMWCFLIWKASGSTSCLALTKLFKGHLNGNKPFKMQFSSERRERQKQSPPE